LEIASRQRTGLWLFLPAAERSFLQGMKHERPLTGGDLDLAGADEAAGLPAVGGHDEIGAADGDGNGRRADLLVTAAHQLAEAQEPLLERAGRFVAGVGIERELRVALQHNAAAI